MTVIGLALIALLDQTQASWVDPDTPLKCRTTEALVDTDDREYKLVCPIFSFLSDLYQVCSAPHATEQNKNRELTSFSPCTGILRRVRNRRANLQRWE
jgi:hypothetical protein